MSSTTQETQGLRFQLKPYQHNFIYSKKRHPAGVMGWGTGKTLCAIGRSRIYSKLIPENLGVIFRKTAKSLSDSTLKDFEKYTRLKVDSQRNLVEKNGSITMFRHIDEIGDINQQNINLGWYYIEQGEELETDKEFFMLMGRLRRTLKPTPEFDKLGLPLRSGWVIANASDGWMRPLWKQGRLEAVSRELFGDDPDYKDMAELIEATTFDNEDNLPKDFINSLKLLEKTKPEIYRRFVMNDWDIASDRFVLVTREQLDLLKIVTHDHFTSKRLISIDPSEGGDACVIMGMENNSIIPGKKKRIFVNDTMKIVGEAVIMANEINTRNFTGDAIGNGKGVFDRLAEMGYNTYPIKSSEESSDPERWFNKRSEMWGHFQDMVIRRELPPINDAEVEKQVLAIRYDPKAVNSRGRVKVVPKDETKKLLGHSPDDADAYIYGLWTLKQIEGDANQTNFVGLKTRHMMGGGAGGW